MSDVTSWQNAFQSTLNRNSDKVRLRYFTATIAAGSYDDTQVLTKSGTDLWISGQVQPVNDTQGSNDAVLLEQGKIKTSDKKIYIKGEHDTSGTIKFGVGSPTPVEHSLIEDGVIAWSIDGTIIYKKIFLRELATGSLVGE